MIELADKWTRQPPPSGRFDPRHPAFAGGLKFFHSFNVGVRADQTGATSPLTVYNTFPSPALGGSGIRLDSATTDRLHFASGVVIDASVPFTAFVYATYNHAATNNGRLLNLRSSYLGGTPIIAFGVGQCGTGGSDKAFSALVRDNSSTLLSVTDTTQITDNKPHLYVVRRTASGVVSAAVDQRKFSLGTATQGFIFDSSNGTYGYDPLNPALGSWNGVILFGGLSNTYWPDSLVDSIAANPWQLYAKRPKRVFVTAGGSAASTISAASGASTASALTGSSTASTTIAVASGASTASAIAGASTAVSTAAAASGASTAQTLSGVSVTVAAISAASGAATAATIAGSSTAATTASAANGAATASTLAGASTAVSTLSAASGVSTASTLTGVAGSGSTIGVAAGVSTAATITASSVAVSTISASSGASSDQIVVGAAFAEAAISGAAGVSTCSTLTGSNAAGQASIEVAAGISSAQIIVGSSFAAAAIAAAAGVATCSTMTGLGGADAEEAYPLRGTTPSYPLSGLESSALTDSQTYPLQGLTQE